MFVPGLVSITYRKQTAAEIIALCRQNGLQAVEWGGDVHVPPGEPQTATEVARQTCDAGLEVACYGSYYRVGVSEAEGLRFEAVLESAVALGAPSIRVWAGNQGSAETTPEQRATLVAETRRIADQAAQEGILIASEYHGGTLTDSLESTRNYLEAVHHPNFRTLWQPPNGRAPDDALATLQDVIGHLQHVHVFHWGPGGWKDRLSLADGQDVWRRYLTEIADQRTRLPEPDRKMYALLEFVLGDRLEQLPTEAAALLRLLEALR